MFVAEIKFHSKSNNFVYIYGVNDKNKIAAFQVFCKLDVPDGRQVYVSGFMEQLSRISLQNVSDFYTMEINALFARRNHLIEGDKIGFKIVNQVAKCQELCLQVENRDDWEIVESNAEQIEMQMINQIRVINANTSFPLWINEFLYIFVHVDSFKPNVNGAMLYDGTTLILGLKNDMKLKNGLMENLNFKIKTLKNQENDDWKNLNEENSMEKCASNIIEYCKLCLMDQEAFPGHVIIEGAPASGCTKLAEKCAHAVCKWHKIFDCKALNSKNLESVTKTLGKLFEECFANQPSILILDDLDQLCSAPSSSKQLTPGAEMHFTRLAKVLCKFLDFIKYERLKCLCVATCRNKSKIHSLLHSSQGHRYFTKSFKVPILNMDDRLEFLQQIAKLKNIKFENSMVLRKLVDKSQGCVLGDLHHLMEKIHISKLGGDEDKKFHIDENDVNFVLKNFESINLHGCNIKNDDYAFKSWSDFGGYENLKLDLEKIFLWPSKYAKIYQKLNIKSTDGVLLYGPTGTGKTVLASLTAKICNLHCIVVKGAELLSKYIGASEEAVRDTFHRARSVRPSMILFDEFDALAPRRGHDSTGVTDRVVNQLLTELDGVEPLDEVYIIATSSRLDLIDPAFLRPGRIGHHFYCGLPNTQERIQILHSLSRNLHFDTEKCANFEILSAKTQGFSGADLKSLLFTSQISAFYDQKSVNRKISDVEDDDVKLENLFTKYEKTEDCKQDCKNLVIRKRHLEEALSKIKPSATESEINMPIILGLKSHDLNKHIGSRATLA